MSVQTMEGGVSRLFIMVYFDVNTCFSAPPV